MHAGLTDQHRQQIDGLLARYSLVSTQVNKQEVRIVLEAVAGTLALGGAVVEFGCYTGTTSLFISRFLSMQKIPREYFVYDSFEGLPEKTTLDLSPAGEQFRPGELRATKKQFLEHYKKAGLTPPRIVKGWFQDVRPDQLPERIACAFLDGDYYESVRIPLGLISPRLCTGAQIVVDDYANEALPGAAKALDTWRLSHTSTLRVAHSMAICGV